MKKEGNIHNIYIDGSHIKNVGGIGVYDSFNKFTLSLVTEAISANDAEEQALYEALKYLQYNSFKGRIFTDSYNNYHHNKNFFKEAYDIDLIWIPRELNKEADELASKYKNKITHTKEKITYNNEVITSKTVVTEETSTKTLTSIEILNIINSYSIEARFNIIKRMSTLSKSNKLIYEKMINTGNNKGLKSQKIFASLIDAIIPTEYIKTKRSIPCIKDNIKYKQGLEELLKKLK